MSPHPAPACIQALLDLIGPADAAGVRVGVAELDGVRVFDGPPLADVDDPDVIALGLSIFEGAVPVQGATRHGFGASTEVFVLTGLTQSWSGEVGMATPRARAYELLTLLGALLDRNRDLGGVCDWARIARHTYRPVQAPSGALALIEFAIQVDATRL